MVMCEAAACANIILLSSQAHEATLAAQEDRCVSLYKGRKNVIIENIPVILYRGLTLPICLHICQNAGKEFL